MKQEQEFLIQEEKKQKEKLEKNNWKKYEN